MGEKLIRTTALLGKVIIGEQHLPENKKVIKSAQDVGGKAGIPVQLLFVLLTPMRW